MFFNKFRNKTVFPSKYSKIFYSFKLKRKSLWKGLTERIKLEKDALILVTGDTGKGKSHFVGNMCFKDG